MARDFNGSSDKINYTLVTGQHSNDAITIGMWLYCDAVDQYANPFRLQDASANITANWEFDNGWGWVFNAQWSSANGAWSIPKPSTGTWFHACVTYSWSSTTVNPVIYINGVSQTINERQAPSGTKVNTGDRLVLGFNPDFWYNGRMAEFSIWNKQLSTEEVAILADGFSSLFLPNGLVFHAPLFGKYSAEPDVMKGTAGTLTGTSAISHPRMIYPSNSQMRKLASVSVAPSALKDLIGGFIPFAR